MKKINYHILTLLMATAGFTACEVVDPMASEQYEKYIYIVGANNRVASFDVPYGQAQETYISISSSGSEKVDRDVEVTLRNEDDLIKWYNDKYMLDQPVKYRKLDPSLVDIPSWKATLKTGELYTRFPFTVTTTGLHCDSLYAITFAIESVSDYQKNGTGTDLIFTLKMANPYSGAYQMDATKSVLREDIKPDGSSEWVEQGLAVPVSIQRTLTAVSADSIRFFHEKQKETLAEYANSWNPGQDYFNAIARYCIKFGKLEGSEKFTVVPWKDMPVLAGEAEYREGMFEFWYDYMEGNTRYRMKGNFR